MPNDDYDIWGNSKSLRLKKARALTPPELKVIHDDLCRGCPETPWPYGNTTSINPLMATLGVSPGNSPNPDDTEFDSRGPQPLPPGGSPHPGMYYKDTKRYWDKMRHLAETTLTPADGSKTHSYALFANVNLDTGASGQAEKVAIDPEFASWVLKSIRDRLRPRFLIGLGLNGYLENNTAVREIFEDTFEGFRLSRPHQEHLFRGYARRRYRFREWDVRGPNGNDIKIVFWPQHPSRAPFTNFGLWRTACEEFQTRHGDILE